jgi:hypothetical protein
MSGATTFSITTLGIMFLILTPIMNDTHYNVMLSGIFYCYAEHCYAEHCYAEHCYAEHCYAEHCYAEHCYAEHCYAECR